MEPTRSSETSSANLIHTLCKHQRKKEYYQDTTSPHLITNQNTIFWGSTHKTIISNTIILKYLGTQFYVFLKF
jgi:hypothetical protein